MQEVIQMEEEKPKEEQPEEPKEQSEIQKAQSVLNEMKAENDRFEKFLNKQEELQVNQMLSGRSDAGSNKPTKEQEDIKAARGLLKGTGFEDQLFPKNDNS